MLTVALCAGLSGCSTVERFASSRSAKPRPVVADESLRSVHEEAVTSRPKSEPLRSESVADAGTSSDTASPHPDSIQPVSAEIPTTASDEQSTADSAKSTGQPTLPPEPDTLPAASQLSQRPVGIPSKVALDDVIESIYRSYPMLRSAMYSRNIAAGEQLSASGQFDLKLKASSENGPVGFYQTYRHAVGMSQPTWGGGEIFAGYRVGRGTFQPWYLERQTNDGGEFKAGASIPLLRNVEIDERRAAVWRANYGRQLVEPDIQAQLIGFVQEGSYAYWEWVAASRRYEIARNMLRLAEERMQRIRRQVEEGFLDPPELIDNQRLVADRRAKLADADRKRRQTANKLSLYYRDAAGQPLSIPIDLAPKFPDPVRIAPEQLQSNLTSALQSRPELLYLDLTRRQLEVDYAAAENDLLPNLDAVVTGSQDMGLPTSKKGDKSPFELEAGIFADVPLQRRKARGKLDALEGKFVQLNAKRQLTSDKIVIEVNNAFVGLEAAYERVLETRKAVELATDLARREVRNEELGLSDMLKVALREQYAVESAEKEVDALLLYFQAQADYRAALALDRVSE